ncbi:hypothetical protein [Anaeromassilibacillus sp. 1001302B_160321_C8]|uniref:hypothetical protein n=1 Tax=Anaeromassilibacillus sp. 1001302B_160321_C8 TaxID=2787132 RepID=UPI00189BA9C1|nr:hypothetical protein [Anaeromassilibacillus sp. 1001302B_160321_C8]
MNITRRRIINPQRYLYALHPGDKFYIAVPLETEDYSRLQPYGLLPESPARIPIPRRAATRMNANGRWKILKNLPKEERFFEHDYHVVDWHGTDHYGTCWQSRWCYQRELIPPTELAFIIEGGVLYSPLLENTDSKFIYIKAAMNIALEMLGRCEVWTAELAPAIPPVKRAEVPWEILRPGTKIQNGWERYIDKIVEHSPKGQQAVIRRRHEHLWHMAPDFCVLGSQNFWGYVVYGFTALNLFVFESNEINNATYAFRGDWEAASKLTKTEVLSGHVQEARVYHSDKWYENTRKLIADLGKGVA